MKAHYPSYQERLGRVLRHIENTLDNPPGLEELSTIACFSPYHFHRIFTAIIGESVAAYTRRLLLQRAAAQSLYPGKRITDIALDAGYDSIDAFTRAFRSFFGIPPSEYRRIGGSPARAQSPGREELASLHPVLGVPLLDVRIKAFPSTLAVAIRDTGHFYDCAPAWQKLFTAFAANDFLGEEVTGYCYHDNPDITLPEKFHIEACLRLPEGVTAESPNVRRILENKEFYLRTVGGEGEYAALLIKGSYTLIHQAYPLLYRDWLPQSGREPGGSLSFEAYYNNPETTLPEDLLSEIYIPLSPR